MSLRIQNNIAAFDAERNLNQTSNRLQQSMARLSSGYRINTAADDAAGLAISEKLRAQIGGLAQANSNAQDGISLVQTAEGSLNEVHAMLQRVRDLAVQYKNGTLSTDDRTAIQSEVNQLGSEIERIGQSAAFNGISLLANSGTITLGAQVGTQKCPDCGQFMGAAHSCPTPSHQPTPIKTGISMSAKSCGPNVLALD